MKQFWWVIIFLNSFSVFSQQSGFEKSRHGLIYPHAVIGQLRSKADSLNHAFKPVPNETYAAVPQALAHYIYLTQGDVAAAQKDMEAGISFESFIAKYPASVTQREVYVIKHTYKNYNGKNKTSFKSLALSDDAQCTLYFKEDLEPYNQPLGNTWVYMYHDSIARSPAYIQAFYFLEDMQQPLIPDSYVSMIQYVDYMVDTTETIFYSNAQTCGGWFETYEVPYEIDDFTDYIDSKCPPPKQERGQKRGELEKQYKAWAKKQYKVCDWLHKHDSTFNTLFGEAVEAAIEEGGTTNRFEEYVGRYVSKDMELEMKRHRIVQGMCSRDPSPDNHAWDIALLAAETNHWNIFLRAHLNILNDRLDRVSGGSYAHAGRETYIKELEAIDLKIPDLLLGISLRIGNPSANHYSGSVERIGRALYESRDAARVEAMMLSMISDPKLDVNNRIVMYYLFLNFNSHAGKKRQAENMEKLHQAVLTLPAYLSVQWNNK